MGMVVLASAASFHQQHHHESLLASAAAEQHPIIPLLAAAPCLVEDDNPAARAKPGGIHLWQPVLPQPPHHLPPAHGSNPNPNVTLSNYLRKPVPMLDPTGIIAGAGAVAAGGGTSTCQDCGNQAKKDCSHRRCRTCCKSRGFECSTHVKSTWVPAARRRERQVSAAAAGSSASTSAPKKPRLVASQTGTASHTSTSNTTPPRSFDTTSSHQDANVKESLPAHVRAPAVFKCVRVTSIDDGEDEYAYHAMVKIGGRVFKGFLYDQGLDDGGSHADDAKDAIPNISELHLGNRNGGASSSSPMLPSDVFGGSGGLMGGTNYGNQMN
ncbi:protein LATERAL ROOT PRIMORDIUM 1-like [Musa acuminata AAA Group]|uniref:protein LATERAL ROOT PRIMORDIUM 1 n=1 Tax=Musa acuminata AAA Group TaxID=214697 RepID=UPI0031D3FEBA